MTSHMVQESKEERWQYPKRMVLAELDLSRKYLLDLFFSIQILYKSTDDTAFENQLDKNTTYLLDLFFSIQILYKSTDDAAFENQD